MPLTSLFAGIQRFFDAGTDALAGKVQKDGI